MATEILFSTTGTSPDSGNVQFNDLGTRKFIHPTTDFDIATLATEEEVLESTDFFGDLDAGYITVKDRSGNTLTTSAAFLVVFGPTMQIRAGFALAAAFDGNPKVAQVTFIAPLADTNYSVSLTPESADTNNSWAPVYSDKQTTGFKISLNSNNKNNLVGIGWQAIQHGET